MACRVFVFHVTFAINPRDNVSGAPTAVNSPDVICPEALAFLAVHIASYITQSKLKNKKKQGAGGGRGEREKGGMRLSTAGFIHTSYNALRGF